jgi:putative transposase
MQHLRRYLDIRDFSPRCTAALLLSAGVAAAAGLTSLVAIARRLLGLPAGETLRTALLANLPARAALERRLNGALAAALPRGLTCRPQPLAIDLTLRPYHGQPLRDPAEVGRGQATSGTSHFHAYATAYVGGRGRRSTVALTAVSRGEAMAEVIRGLLRLAGRGGVRPRDLLLDRGLCAVAVIRYPQAARRPFLMPLPLRGRTADHPDGPAGRRVFADARRSGWAECTLTAGQRTATVRVAVKCRNFAGQWGRTGRQRLVYAVWGLTPPSADWVRPTYRTRCGIETSYRQMNQAKVHACTRNPDVRLLFAGVALVLRNVWVWRHYQVFATPRRGGRVRRLERLRFKLLLRWLAAVVESDYVTHDEPTAERTVPTVVAA